MTIEQIKYFLELSRTLNFTSAAERMFVSQPAFSKQIKKLEEEIGTPLIRRTTKKAELTPAGEVFRTEFSDIISSMERALKRVRDAGRETIRIAVFQPFSGSSVLTELLSRLSSKFPGHDVNIFLMKYYELTDACRNADADFFVAPLEFMDAAAAMNWREIAPLGYDIVYSNKLTNKDSVSVSDFSGHTLVVPDDRYAPEDRGRITGWLSEHGCIPAAVKKTGDINGMIKYIGPGEYFAIVYSTVRAHTEGLRVLPLDDTSLRSSICVFSKDEQTGNLLEKLYPEDAGA